jgi:DNA replication protein DnaC
MRARHAHPDTLSAQAKLTALNLPFMREHYQPLAKTAADKHWSHLDYFSELLNGEAAQREDRRVQRCIRQARFPVLKTIDTSRAASATPWRAQRTSCPWNSPRRWRAA